MKKAYYGLLTFAIMSLSYDLYYWKMRSAVGVLRGEDKFLCLSSGSICVLINDLQKYFKKQRILCDSKIQRCKIETSHPFSITKLYW